MELVADGVEEHADDHVCDEEGDGQEGEDVVLAEVSLEVVQGCQDCVPAQQCVDAIDEEDGVGRC